MKRSLQASASGWTRARARMLRTLIERTPVYNIVANRRFPEGWRRLVDRAFDAGRLDMDHPDEWVFYQLDYHWTPAAAFTDAIFADAFKRRPGDVKTLITFPT